MPLPSIPTELNLGDRCLDGVLNNNNYESDILKVPAPHAGESGQGPERPLEPSHLAQGLCVSDSSCR